ncbi:hypothetical protein FF38_02493 [Lucilia cuprina]|uniref:Uncharacterized protein n=1 Tax=Lucilia cuprina TaxID=7375 RepID=A0A0L0CP25_LUCCU|nr:hypothetical protein FF38_02493 [Lucilia cuprina]
MTGGDGLESVRLLLDFGMPLRKWCANEECLLQGLDPSQIEGDLNIDSNNLKTSNCNNKDNAPRFMEVKT